MSEPNGLTSIVGISLVPVTPVGICVFSMTKIK